MEKLTAGVELEFRGTYNPKFRYFVRFSARRLEIVNEKFNYLLKTQGEGGEFIKSVGEEYQVVKSGRDYHGRGEEYNVEKK